ncbi:TBC1 domain family member 20 [Geosmithia morbida]|uniref:TBC1 domain family member 20 n=1 Tax=Geosmithia morbida TaxID=1094350 RepID=A0A9P4Z0P6_9HYPO|nr:TBC1 domain family member 20 [Geosmithia morbida]KAF4125289.1 TBC1 domain family member 20 [Geosmithia morbida]
MAQDPRLTQPHHPTGHDKDSDDVGQEAPSQPTTTESPSAQSTEFIDPFIEQKTADISDACKSKDAARLRVLAQTRAGLVSDELRQQAWPILLGVPSHDATDSSVGEKTDASTNALLFGDWKELPPHADEDQVKLDVDRSFVYYPRSTLPTGPHPADICPVIDQSDADLDKRKSELSVLIIEVLRRYPFLCYFQGYHDICQVFVLVLPRELRASAVARLSVLRIRDFMLPNLAATTAQLRLLPDIIGRADTRLWRHLVGVEPFYALSGTLTMYAHNVEAYHDISRLFDVFLAREPVFSIYMFAQIVISRREEIFDIDDPDILHVILSKVPPGADFDKLIEDSVKLFDRHPPETLRSWKSISDASALKTMRHIDTDTDQTLEEGSEHFEQQVNELKWAEFQDRVRATLWAYRRPATTFGTAMAVGALAFYLRRNPAIVHHITSLFSR